MRWLFFLAISFGSLTLPVLFKRVTHSFHLSRCYSSVQGGPNLGEIPDGVFAQDFYYLDRGSQAFVFASEDGRTVLKLFFFDPLRPSLAECGASLFRFAKVPCSRNGYAQAKTLYEGCRLAFLAKEETGFLYAHLNPGLESKLPIVSLKGPFLRRTELPLDRVHFALQMKATPLQAALLDSYQKRDLFRFRHQIDSLFSTVKSRVAHGIVNEDPKLVGNFGFIGERAVEIDFGHYIKRESTRELKLYISKLSKWMSQYTPEWKDEVVSQVVVLQ